MRDEDLHAKLDRLLAGQADLGRRQAGQDLVLSQVVQAVGALVEPLAVLREAVTALADAAQEGSSGADLVEALRDIAGHLAEHTGLLATISEGLERLPAIMEDTALNAAALASGGGAGPRPSVPRPVAGRGPARD